MLWWKLHINQPWPRWGRAQERLGDSGQPKVGRCQHFFPHKLEMKRHVGQTRGGASERYCSRDIMVDRRRNTSIRVSHDASPLYPFQEKNGRGGWWMARLTGGEQSGVSPEGLRGENDYFLAKWFWLELQLNLVWDGPLNQHSNTWATVWLNSLKSERLKPDLNFLIWLDWVIPARLTAHSERTNWMSARLFTWAVSSTSCHFKRPLFFGNQPTFLSSIINWMTEWRGIEQCIVSGSKVMDSFQPWLWVDGFQHLILLNHKKKTFLSFTTPVIWPCCILRPLLWYCEGKLRLLTWSWADYVLQRVKSIS